ncbi:hypothetical protein KFL_000040470 [Klebsormidium nitens]|uniref:Uncharacterized protein n=1 Tax=Klebsormidium nitens TaxID=105231 RepID=A0A1Y1HMS5_KLENI|nr:hypothetical protein KFL_000040470 [Klebsormidium nitens]|eukprot:GAQ77847.1 hypothetical protein KFL_000040470 [Klebsormidium nitens]
MGCGCLGPVFGGKRTKRRVQSHSDHTGETPASVASPSAVHEEAAGVKSKLPPVSAEQDKPLPVDAENENGHRSGGESGVSSSALADSTAGGVNAHLARGQISLIGAAPEAKGAFTLDGDAGNAGTGNRLCSKLGDEPPTDSTSGRLGEAAVAPASRVANEVVEKESAETAKTASCQEESTTVTQAAKEGEFSSVKTDGESGAKVLSAVPQSLDREVSIVADWLEQGLVGQGAKVPMQSAPRLAGIGEGLEQSDVTFPKLVVELNPEEQLASDSQERSTQNNKRASHNPAASSEARQPNPSSGDPTVVLTKAESPLSALISGAVPITKEETAVALQEISVEGKGRVDTGGASPQGDPSGAPRSSEKNRASHLQQAFLVADLGFQMEPVRKERPKLDQIPADSAGVQKRTALEQLSLQQLDIDDDLLSDLSPRAESVPSPVPAGTEPRISGTENVSGNEKGKAETASHGDASESDTPGRESSFLTDASENGKINRNVTRQEGSGGMPRSLQPSPVSDGPVSPVQAALRLIKRSQRLASPSKKRRSVESPGAGSGMGSGTEKSGREVSIPGSEPDASPPEQRPVLEAKGAKAKGSVESSGRLLPETEIETSENSRNNKVQKLRAVSRKHGGRPVDLFRAEESAQEDANSQASSPVKLLPSEASEATTVGSSSPVGSTSESLMSDARVTRVARSRDGRQVEKARGSGSERHSTIEELQAGTNKKGLRVSDVILSSSEAEKKQFGRDGSQRRAVGPVTSPPQWREKRGSQKAAPEGKGAAGELEAATWRTAVAGATARGDLSRDASSEALQDGDPPLNSSAHKAENAGTGPAGVAVSPVGPTGHWQEVKASLQQPTLSWREKLSQLEESVHLFSDASKFTSRGVKSRGSGVAKDPLADVVPSVGSKSARGRESGREVRTGQVAPGQKGLSRSITTPSKRGVWKEEVGRSGSKLWDAQKGKGVIKEEKERGREVTDAKPQLLRSKSLPRERPERSDRSAVATKPTDLASKQLWLAAEEKRIKDEAVRLAGLAASLERETERLERQRAQAEKLEREMRERFGALHNRSDRPSPQSEGLPSTDRWAVGTVKRQASKRGGDKEEATVSPSEALLLSPPRSRSQPGSRASSRPRSRKGEERARRSLKDEDSSSSGTKSNRSARSVRRKRFERSKSAGRLRTSELGRLPSGRKAAEAFGFSGDEFLTGKGGRSDAEKRGGASKWDDVLGRSARQGRSASAKLADLAKSAKAARSIPPVDVRQGSDTLEALYRAVSTGARLGDDVIKHQPTSASRRMTGDDVGAPEGATSPASSLSSQNGSGSARERKRNQRTEQKQSVKDSAHREPVTRFENVKKVPARARASDWLETDAETDMEEVRRKMRRKEMQELAELEEFEEIEKKVMDC